MNAIIFSSLESLGVFILGFIAGWFFHVLYLRKKKEQIR